MRIKMFFYVLVFLIVGLGVLVGCWAGEMSRLRLSILGGIIALILYWLNLVYARLVKPLNSIGNGMDLLREQDFSSRLSPVGQYEADRIVKIFNRLMEQLKNERLHVREQNHFLDLLIQASPMGVIILSLNDAVAQANPMAAKMAGLQVEDLLGKKLNQVNAPLIKELDSLKRDEKKVVRLSDANVYMCTCSYFINRGFRHPFYLIERMTDEVMRAERKAYEKVIRMIAHEANNMTAGITSTLDTIGQALAEEKGMEDICGMMRVCIERCLSMSRFITRFADVVKIPEPNLQPASLNELAAASKHFMEGMCNSRRISLRLECDPEVGEVRLDMPLFEQVLVNIIKNAAESIGEDGEIVIRTIAPACIEVADNGPGISKECEEKLFTPFFSAKPNGQGIGLVFIREVLSRHGCAFSLRTYEDGLTRFKISFA